MFQKSTNQKANILQPKKPTFYKPKNQKSANQKANILWTKKPTLYTQKNQNKARDSPAHRYGVATISRLLKIIGLFCKRSLWKRLYSAKETYYFKESINRSHPITGQKKEVRRCTDQIGSPKNSTYATHTHTHTHTNTQTHTHTHTRTHAHTDTDTDTDADTDTDTDTHYNCEICGIPFVCIWLIFPYVRTYVCSYTRKFVCMFVWSLKHSRARSLSHTHINTRTHIQTHAHTYIHAGVCVHTHAHTHTCILFFHT